MSYKINWTETKKQKVIGELTKWIEENRAYSGEAINQSDSCQLSVIDLLTVIVDDILKPKYVEDN